MNPRHPLDRGGSGALFIIGTFSFNLALPSILAVLAVILVTVTMRIQEPEIVVDAGDQQSSVMRRVTDRLNNFGIELYRGFIRSGIGPKVGVVFSLLPSGALALQFALLSTMQVDLGMNENQIARLMMLVTILGALGCVSGGWISDRMGHGKTLAV